MHHPLENITAVFKGRFIATPVHLREKFESCKAYVFDWDGVFNDGFKNENGSSPYSEVDAMGTNLLRFNHFLRTGNNPVFAVITGEHNQSAFALSVREQFHSVYFRIKHKVDALNHLCQLYDLHPREICFVFDDVLDLSAAQVAGVRIMVPNGVSPLLVDYARAKGLADYTTYSDGHHHAVRETTELLTGISGHYDDTIRNRMEFSDTYRQYLEQKQAVQTSFFTADSSNQIQAASI